MQTHFYDVSLANIVTWFIFVTGFFGTQYVVVKLQGERIDVQARLSNEFKEWMKEHQTSSNGRDKILERLTTLSEGTERRIKELENTERERRRYVRNENPEPYYGEERRKR